MALKHTNMYLLQGLCTCCLSAWNAVHSDICLVCSLTPSGISSNVTSPAPSPGPVFRTSITAKSLSVSSSPEHALPKSVSADPAQQKYSENKCWVTKFNPSTISGFLLLSRINSGAPSHGLQASLGIEGWVSWLLTRACPHRPELQGLHGVTGSGSDLLNLSSQGYVGPWHDTKSLRGSTEQ